MAGAKNKVMPSDDYQVDDDHRTLQRASQILTDPDRMKRVQARHNSMTQSLNAMSSTIGKGIKKPRSKRQIAKLAILRRQRGR